jgi:hypothetical protein
VRELSLKLIELQVALHRTHDVSKIQEQLEQRSQQMQENVAISTQKEADAKRKNVNKNEENQEAKFEENQSSSNSSHQKRNGKEREKKEKQIHHPYKGNFIDFVG